MTNEKDSKKMTDEEVLALYDERIELSCNIENFKMHATANEVRECLAASNLDEAAAVLRRYGWGEAEECAAKLRASEVCQKCKGTGYV